MPRSIESDPIYLSITARKKNWPHAQQLTDINKASKGACLWKKLEDVA